MFNQADELKIEIDKAIEQVACLQGAETAAKVKTVLYANLDRKRVQAFIEDKIERVGEYVQKVAATYNDLHIYIDRLQVEGSACEWQALFNLMHNWAYNFLVRKGFFPNRSTWDIASECASEASIHILGAHFPFDTDFEPWAHVIVQNTCRKYIRKGTKASVIPQMKLVNIDKDCNDIEDPALQRQVNPANFRADLMDAVRQLSNERRRVIEMAFFDELAAVEISKKMDKSIEAVYSLKFHALHDLRNFLGPHGDGPDEQ